MRSVLSISMSCLRLSPLTAFSKYFRAGAVLLAILLCELTALPAWGLGTAHASFTFTTTAANVLAGTPFTVTGQVNGGTSAQPPLSGSVILSGNGAPLVSQTSTAPFTLTFTGNTAASPLYPGTHTYVLTYQGNAYWAPFTSTLTVTVNPIETVHAQDLGTVNLGSSTKNTIALHFNRDTTLGSFKVVTQGLTGYDFQPSSSGTTCKVGSAYKTGDQCNVNVTFKPTQVGLRMGAVLLYDPSSVLIETKFLSGVGSGGVLYNTKKLTQIPVQHTVNSVVSDPAGNLYIASYGGIYEYMTNGTTVLLTGASSPLSGATVSVVALDGAGNLYIDGGESPTSVTIRFMLPAGSTNLTPIDNAPGLPIKTYLGMAIDPSGDLILTDPANDRVVTLPAGGVSPSTAIGGFTGNIVAANATGDIFVAGRGGVFEKKPGVPTPIQLDSSLSPPINNAVGIAVDAADTVYVSDENNARLVLLNADGTHGQVVLNFYPSAVAVDGLSTVFIGTPYTSGLYSYKGVLPAHLNFGSATVGNTPATASLPLTNFGNGPLQVSPTITPSQYKIVSGCEAPLPANTSCTLQLSFTPTAGSTGTGTTVTGSLTLTTDHSPHPVHSIALTAQAVAP